MDSELDISEFCCLNKDCPDLGKKGKGNIRVKERYGSKNRALLRCNTWTHCFSETRCTIFFGLKTPDEEVLRILAMIPEKGSIRGTAIATGYDKDTICIWLDIAGAHCKEVTDYFFQELELGQVQIDEIWSYIKKKEKNVTDDDPDEYGDYYTLTAMESNTKLFISHHEGGRSTDDATELLNDFESKRSNTSPIPLFTSDDWDPFELGLLNVYGSLEQPPYCGIGRKPLPFLVPPEDLKYAQVCKKVAKGQVVKVRQHVVFGDTDEILRLFGADSGGCINT